jgi:hypothetical protein
VGLAVADGVDAGAVEVNGEAVAASDAPGDAWPEVPQPATTVTSVSDRRRARRWTRVDARGRVIEGLDRGATRRMVASRPVRDLGDLRLPPAGMPTTFPTPPVLAESADPFTNLRVIDLVARLPRGRPVGLPAIVDRLNATHLDWLFEARVVADALVQLQSNWIADYRNTAGIVLDEGPDGAILTIEDSTRVDPWIARQAQRLLDACREVLDDFSRRDRRTGGD